MFQPGLLGIINHARHAHGIVLPVYTELTGIHGNLVDLQGRLLRLADRNHIAGLQSHHLAQCQAGACDGGTQVDICLLDIQLQALQL